MSFSKMHPLTQFIFFIASIAAVIVNSNPVFAAVSLFFALFYRAMRIKSLKIIKEILLYILLVGIAALAVTLSCHNGKTVYLFINDNAITKEAIILGISYGLKLSAIVCWFSGMVNVMTAERLVFVLSRISSRLAVFVSRIMKFFPTMRQRYVSILKTQNNIYSGHKNLKRKIHIRLRSISALVTWSIENSADNSDAMYARGYGLSGRTSFSIYSFRRLDYIIILLITYMLPFTMASGYFGMLEITLFPEIVYTGFNVTDILICGIWAVIMLIPCITEICEEYKWILLRSKI